MKIIFPFHFLRAKKKITLEDIAPEDYDYLHPPQSSGKSIKISNKKTIYMLNNFIY